MTLVPSPHLDDRPLPPGYPRRAEPRPCVDCGQSIARGQLYVIDGPRHIPCHAAMGASG